MRNAKLLNYLHLHFIVFIWGFTAVIGKLITIEAIPLVWYRMGVAFLFMAAFVFIKKKKLIFPKKVIIQFMVLGAVIALHWITFFQSIKESNVSIALSVMATGAFFTSFLEPLFYGRKIILYEVLFGVAVILGLAIIFQAETGYGYGILLALISAFLSAVFSVGNGKLAEKYDAATISFYEIGLGVLYITIYLFFSGNFTTSFFELPKMDWVYLIILATACTAYAFIASIHVMKWLSPYTVMLTINLEPVYGIILALLILKDDEYMTPLFYYGALIIVATVIANGIIKTRNKRKNKTLS